MKNGLNHEARIVSELETYWHHCGRCGSLFESALEDADGRRCPHCGCHPVAGLPESNGLPAVLAPVAAAAIAGAQPVMLSSGRVSHSRGSHRRRMRPAVKVVLVWLCLMAALVGIAYWQWPEHFQRKPVATVVGEGGVDGSLPEPQPADQVKPADPAPPVVAPALPAEQGTSLLELALPECREVLAAMLSVTDPDQRAALVLNGVEKRQRMVEFEGRQPMLLIAPTSLVLVGATVIQLPEGGTILTQWETQSGALFDAAFRLELGHWKLDWEHFVRYSEVDWTRFVAGSGPEEAEFRLLARRRGAAAGDPPGSLGVMLHGPMRKHQDEAGFQAPMQLLALDSPDGRLLHEAFERDGRREPPFGASMAEIKPEGMVRVRVRVRRIAVDGLYTYHITRVLACHWYDSSAVENR